MATQVGIDGMQQHFLNEMEISQPTRMPRPSRVWLTPGGSRICCPGVGGDVRKCLILSFSDGFRQFPPAPMWHVLGRARNSSEVLISGLKEGPHDCDHAAPLVLCDGARGFGHALIKALNNSRGSLSLPELSTCQPHLQHPKSGRCSARSWQVPFTLQQLWEGWKGSGIPME